MQEIQENLKDTEVRERLYREEMRMKELDRKESQKRKLSRADKRKRQYEWTGR